MSKSQIIALYELRISVEACGILVMLFKYPVTFTGKNYMPQMVTDELRSQGFNFGLPQRVLADDLMKVHRTGLSDKTTHVGRDIYFLEGDLDKAKDMLKASLEEAITSMKKQMDGLHSAWTERKMRPRASERAQPKEPIV
jgi:hypothetical protein